MVRNHRAAIQWLDEWGSNDVYMPISHFWVYTVSGNVDWRVFEVDSFALNSDAPASPNTAAAEQAVQGVGCS